MANQKKHKLSDNLDANSQKFGNEQLEYIATLEQTINFLRNEIENYKQKLTKTQSVKENFIETLFNEALIIANLPTEREIAERTHKLMVKCASAIESNFYFYDKNQELKPILVAETSAFLDKYIYHLEEQGIIDWIFEQNTLRVIPNLDENINKQNSVFIYPIILFGNRFGVFLASSIIQHYAIENEFILSLEKALKIIADALLNIFLIKINNELNDKFNVLNQQLVHTSLIVSVGEISAVVAREIENPIKIIQANLDLIERSIGSVEQRAKVIKENISQINHLNSYIKNLVVTDEQKKIVNIQELIKETLSFLHYQIANRDIKIVTSLDKETIYCECFRNQIQHVLLNLLLNARDAMPNGGVITIGCFKQGERRFSISIADTGEGIPDEDIPNIFEPHFSKKSGTEKLAINLYISRLIIQNHKGRITFASEVGKGTTFKIVLPIAKVL